ncbi:MAG: HupE/UreJ family protein [Rhodospirillaceae bacterium]|nr:HupE/UreJ family protein [Rhodospirillaceae bacterium]
MRLLVWRTFLAIGVGVAPCVAFAHGVSDDARLRMADGSYFDFVVLGAEHMVTGYDHLLFLVGVIFFLRKILDIVKFVTAFTVGHTITLILATYFQISANYYLIDAVIALTVAYKGFENLDGFKKVLDIDPPNLIFLVFLFGLVHGFGLSTRLQEFTSPQDPTLIGKILAFNLGVEFGQIAALFVMSGAVALFRRAAAWQGIARATNIALVFAGFGLLLMQMHEYSHSVYAEDYAISRDDHAHAHEEMNAGLHSHDGGPLHTHEADAAPTGPAHD